MTTFAQFLAESKIKALRAEIDAGIAFARAKGIRIPTIKIENMRKKGGAGFYGPGNDTIWLDNTIGLVGRPPRFSTNHRFHILLHELGHCAHSDRVGTRFDTIRNLRPTPQLAERIKAEVSTYAGVNGLEFVAEVFAALVVGKTFDADIMRYYTNICDGPMP